MGYSTTNCYAKMACIALGWNFNIHPVAVMVRNEKTYIKGTALKPDEARTLKQFCDKHGFFYKGPFVR